MPPTVMTPWFTVCCGLCVLLVGPAAAEPLPPELACAPELALPLELAFPPEALWPADAAPLLTMGARGDVLRLLAGVGVPDVARLLGVPVPELVPGEAV
jgi:hypothetical protein